LFPSPSKQRYLPYAVEMPACAKQFINMVGIVDSQTLQSGNHPDFSRENNINNI
jgi:hypothetical protein